MIIKNLLAELELQLSDIAFSGLRNIQPVTLQKLEDLKHWMNELNMSEAIRLTDRFIDSVYACKPDKQPWKPSPPIYAHWSFMKRI